MLPPSTRSPQLLSLGFSAGHCGEDPVKDRRPLDREAQRVTPEASSHCEPTSGEPCAPVRAARCWILYAPFFRVRANSAWAGLRARILYRPCPGGRIQGGRSGSSTSFTSEQTRWTSRRRSLSHCASGGTSSMRTRATYVPPLRSQPGQIPDQLQMHRIRYAHVPSYGSVPHAMSSS